jgi:hypothetical protein
MSTTEGRAPTAPEIMRDVELVIDERLQEERRRRRAAERLGKIVSAWRLLRCSRRP